MSALPPELLQAFAETHYIVHHEAPFTLYIGQSCLELKALMAEHNALSAAFINAWNPFSQKSRNPNEEQVKFFACLDRQGLEGLLELINLSLSRTDVTPTSRKGNI